METINDRSNRYHWSCRYNSDIFLNTSLNYLSNRHADAFFAFTVGAFLWLCAEASWAYYREGLGVEVPYPSIADLFWLIGYGFFFVHNYRLLSKLREASTYR